MESIAEMEGKTFQDALQQEGEQSSKNWYVIRTYAGVETWVKERIEERVQAERMEEWVGEMLIPTEKVIEIKNGKKRVVTKKLFPGYILANMQMNEALQAMVKSTPKVSGFLGHNAPTPLTTQEVSALFKQVDEGAKPSQKKSQFEVGNPVRIIDGPFLGFAAVVDEVNLAHERLKAMVSIFGRSTPVDLAFGQVEKTG